MIDIIGAPFDLCGMRLGSRLGPAALRLAGLSNALEAVGIETRDLLDVPAPADCAIEKGDGLRNFRPLLDHIRLLREKVLHSLTAGSVPLVLGGEHTLAVAGISAGLQHFQGDLAVLWIDAHADVNTPGSSTSGNVHGMPVAALWGLPSEVEGAEDQDWQSLLEVLGTPRLRPELTAWYALRDVDPAERPRLTSLAVTMNDIDRRGVDATVHQVHQWLQASGARNLWVSFDVDCLDPILAPGTGTAVRGGLTYREAHLCAEILHECLSGSDCSYRLAGLDIVETNPLVDSHNETAKMGVEWVASLFGKTILGKR